MVKIPREILAGTASRSIQKETQERRTISKLGRKVDSTYALSLRSRWKYARRQGKFPATTWRQTIHSFRIKHEELDIIRIETKVDSLTVRAPDRAIYYVGGSNPRAISKRPGSSRKHSLIRSFLHGCLSKDQGLLQAYMDQLSSLLSAGIEDE